MDNSTQNSLNIDSLQTQNTSDLMHKPGYKTALLLTKLLGNKKAKLFHPIPVRLQLNENLAKGLTPTPDLRTIKVRDSIEIFDLAKLVKFCSVIKHYSHVPFGTQILIDYFLTSSL